VPPLLLVIASLVACDLPPERSTRGRGPRVVASDPVHGQDDVDRAATPRVFFDRPLLPGDVHRGNVSVRSGARTAFALPRFDPIERVLLVQGLELDPTVAWRLRVENVRDLDGQALAEPWEIAFRTGEIAEGEVVPPPPTFEEVGPLLAERCGGQGCHAPPDPALGLDLSSGAAVRATAIGVVAEQTRTGAMTDRPWLVRSSLTGLARIDVVGGVGRPAHSYLLYKLLGDPHAWGSPMPPDGPLPPDELRRVADWILAGAPTD
jgi:hypothetical protein